MRTKSQGVTSAFQADPGRFNSGRPLHLMTLSSSDLGRWTLNPVIVGSNPIRVTIFNLF